MTPTPSEEQRQRVEEFQRTNQLGLATLFFSDLVGSTQLKQSLGDRGAIQLIQAHHAAFRELLARFANAEEIDTAGDSFFLIFATPSDAVRFALLAQMRTNALAVESGYPLRDRIGIHVGEVFIQAAEHAGKVKDLFGIQVDTCARVMSLGEGDQILLSRFAFDNARQALRGDALEGVGELAWLNHGFYEMKGVEEPVEICEVGEVGRASLKAPEAGEKGHRIVTGDEPVLGWRPAAGQTVPNTQWVLDRVLGEGGFGEVWLARHQTLKDRRVFKFCFNAEKARSLKREVTLFRVLREHVGARPGIVTVHDVYFDQPPYYIVMDHIDGPTLTGWAETHAPLDAVPLETRLEIVAQIADALQTAHDAGVIHRDVKPSNILIADEAGAPRAMLTDFGIGQLVSGETTAGITQIGFTQTMMAMDSLTGTQLYLAPEMLAGQPASTRSDIYALGVVLYQLTTGALNRPLTSDWADDIADPLLREDIRLCVAGDPAKRFAGAAQLASNLRALPQRREEMKREEQQRVKSARRRKQRLAAIAAAIVLLVAVVVLAVAFGREKKLRGEIAEQARRAEDNARTAERNEQKATETLGRLRGTAPTFVAQAQSLVERQQFTEALEKIDFAVQLAPAEAEHHFLRGNLLESLSRLAEAKDAYDEALRLQPGHALARQNRDLCEQILRDDPGPEPSKPSVAKLNALMRQQGRSGEAIGTLRVLSKDKEALLKTWTAAFEKAGIKVYPDTIQFGEDGLFRVHLHWVKTSDDFAFMRGMPVSDLNLQGTKITNLQPLSGSPLRVLILSRTPVRDLGPLRGLKLKELDLRDTAVSDLSPLAGMPLEKLNLHDGKGVITDISALKGMPLKELNLGDPKQLQDISALRGMPLRALTLNTWKVRDWTPLAGLPLENLNLGNSSFSDLRILRGMPLRKLNLINHSTMDYDQLAGLPLEELVLWDSSITDLSPLASLKLKVIDLRGTKVSDLSPLRGMPMDHVLLGGMKQVTDFSVIESWPLLREVQAANTAFSDLRLLAGKPLEVVDVQNTPVSDLSPLRGSRIHQLCFAGSKVTDLSPLKDMPELERVTIPKEAVNIELLRSLPNLRSIGTEHVLTGGAPPPAAEFWKEYDAQQAAGKK